MLEIDERGIQELCIADVDWRGRECFVVYTGITDICAVAAATPHPNNELCIKRLKEPQKYIITVYPASWDSHDHFQGFPPQKTSEQNLLFKST